MSFDLVDIRQFLEKAGDIAGDALVPGENRMMEPPHVLQPKRGSSGCHHNLWDIDR